MKLLNHFEDLMDEQAYSRSERLSRRRATSVLLAITILLFLIYGALNPGFFPGQDMTSYYVATGAMVITLLLGLTATRTRLYLEWRLFDVVLFAVSVAAITAITVIMASMKDDFGNAFQRMATANLNAVYVYNSIIFVANFRYFLYSVMALTVVYLAYLAVIAVPVFVIATVLAKLIVFLSFAVFVNWVIDTHAREVFATERELNREREKSEDLLYRVLPQAVANRLRAGKSVADSFDNVTVIFVDIVSSSALATRLSPKQLVDELTRFFTLADSCAERHRVEKVKTIGDAYLAVSGGIASGGQSAAEAVAFSRELIAGMSQQSEETGIDVQVRIGIHTGPVVGGVVGSQRLAYDYWGNTVNIASRIQHEAEPNGIVISATTRSQCSEVDNFDCAEIVDLKGIGPTHIYSARMSKEPYGRLEADRNSVSDKKAFV